MDRVSVFVDAGYLFAQGSALLFGEKKSRGELLLNYELTAEAFGRIAAEVSGLPLLRIYWYDGTNSGPTTQQNALAYLASVKVRLGFVNTAGQQKGVDSLIVTDMIELARNRAMADALLLSGDEDLRVGVQQAQLFGVRVHLLGIKPARGTQSTFLLQEADTTHEWGEEQISPLLSLRSQHHDAATVNAESNAADPLLVVARDVASEISDPDLASLAQSYSIPAELDGRLLGKAKTTLQRLLNSEEKTRVRDHFRQHCRERLTQKLDEG